MHNHNNNGTKGGGHKGMMWMMLVCCAVPLVVLFFVGGNVSVGGYFWPILIGAFIIIHIWMMFRGHRGKNEKQ